MMKIKFWVVCLPLLALIHITPGSSRVEKYELVKNEMKIKKSNLVTLLPHIEKEFKISFDLFVTKHQAPGTYRSVIHFTTDKNNGKYGYRIPGIWIRNKKLHICFALNGNPNFIFNTAVLKERNWINVEISQTLLDDKYMYKIQINKERVFIKENTKTKVFNNVKIFVGDPWYAPVNGKIRNLLVEQTEKKETTVNLPEVSCSGQHNDGGLPCSEFPGIDSETVCSKQSCDPQILKLYKNSSFIEMENLLKIEEINKSNQAKELSWVAGSTSLLSISYSEVQAFRMGEIPPSGEERRQSQARNQETRQFLRSLEINRGDRINFPSPIEVFTTDANDQGVCSSCSAFSVTAALETCVAKVVPNPAFRFASPRGFSSQNVLDCAFGNPGLFGCDGGQSFRYLEWLKDGTLDTNRQYPYLDSGIKFEGLNNEYRICYQSGVRATAVMNKSHSSWDDHTERDLENILIDGHAIITTMDIQEDFMFYKSGVYQSASCQDWKLGIGRDVQWKEESGLRPLRHAVVIVGFGEEKGRKYWKIKNSWGENWGSSGFFKIIRNGSAHCGLGAYFSVALCTGCRSQGDCKARSQGSVKPAQRHPPNLPEEGIGAGFTSHLATPLGGVGFSTCPDCANLSECPKLAPCKTKRRNGKDKCCRVFGGSGNRLYCPTRC